MGQELKRRLLQCMEDIPPDMPTPQVVEAFLAVGTFYDHLAAHVPRRETTEDVDFHPTDVLAHFIREWMRRSLVRFRRSWPQGMDNAYRKCCAGHVTPPPRSGIYSNSTKVLTLSTEKCDQMMYTLGVRVPVLIKSVLALLHDEVLLYQRIVEYWPCFENTLERVVCDALRYVMATISEECGMYRIQKVDVHAVVLGTDMAAADVFQHSPSTDARCVPYEETTPSRPSSCWQWKGVSDFAQSTHESAETLLTSAQARHISVALSPTTPAFPPCIRRSFCSTRCTS